jgi:hypothetical protein
MRKLNIIQGVITMITLLFWLGTAVSVVSLVTAKDGKPYGIYSLRLVVKDEGLQDKLKEALTANLPEPIQVNAPEMRMSKPLDLELRLAVAGLIIVGTAYITTLLVLFKNIIQDIRVSNSFNLRNIQRVKLLGLLVLLDIPISWLVSKFFLWRFQQLYSFEGMEIQTENLHVPWTLLLGFMIVVLGVAFEQAQKIQQENELTI